MGVIKNMSLKKSFLAILLVCLIFGAVLAVLSNVICGNIYDELAIEYGIQDNSIQIKIDDNGNTIITPEESTTNTITKIPFMLSLVSVLQTLLPIVFLTLSVIVADILYYRMKIKRPLEILQDGANRIINQDLDFAFEEHSKDELGLLCDSFEVMRKSLLQNNKELWRQAEERKRLNAAFAHELRNPVAVIKNTSKLLPKTCEVEELANLLSEYSQRIEKYVDIMSKAQSLEEIEFSPCEVMYFDFVKQVGSIAQDLHTETNINISNISQTNKSILIDISFIEHILENIITNADRFANERIDITISTDNEYVVIDVADDGIGFEKENLDIKPFFKSEDNKDDDYHFGMGLYICDLFAKKHGGNITLSNENGAKVTVKIKIK